MNVKNWPILSDNKKIGRFLYDTRPIKSADFIDQFYPR